jgi:hypothetical protein
MVSGKGEPPFGPDAWSACLKVLEALGKQPDDARIEGLDFRSLPAVVAFADGLLSGRAGLDILINNAAQTVRRTPDYDDEAEALERMGAEALPANPRRLLGVQPMPERPTGSGPLGLSGRAGTSGAEVSTGPSRP